MCTESGSETGGFQLWLQRSVSWGAFIAMWVVGGGGHPRAAETELQGGVLDSSVFPFLEFPKEILLCSQG